MPAQDKSRAKRKATGITTNAQARASHRSSHADSSVAAARVVDANRVSASLRMTGRQLAEIPGLEIGARNKSRGLDDVRRTDALAGNGDHPGQGSPMGGR